MIIDQHFTGKDGETKIRRKKIITANERGIDDHDQRKNKKSKDDHYQDGDWYGSEREGMMPLWATNNMHWRELFKRAPRRQQKGKDEVPTGEGKGEEVSMGVRMIESVQFDHKKKGGGFLR